MDAETEHETGANQSTVDAYIGLPAELLARYEMQSCLGQGGMGIVYKALDRETGETVALKMIRGKFAEQPLSEEEFKTELRLARKVTHRNVCRIHEFGRAGDLAYFSMEYVEGETLRSLLRRVRRLALSDGIRLGLDLCSALEEAHRQGVIHRDIKPENIMIDHNGDAKLMDFGIARPAGTSTVHAVSGTPLYMSPEQGLGLVVDERSDLYSLGLVLCEVFGGSDALTSPERLGKIAPGVPPHLETAILRCLEKRPDLRFASAKELAAALGAGEALSTGDALGDDGAAVPARWRKALVAVTATVLLALAVLLVWRMPRGIGTLLPYGANRNLVLLPIRVLGGSAEDQVYCDGLTETLATTLGRLQNITVIPPSKVWSAKVSDVRQARDDLGAGMVLQSSWQRAGNQVRVNMVLLDARSERPIAQDTFTAGFDNPFDFQDQAVARVAHMLGGVNGPGETRELNSHGTASPRAQAFFLRGRGYLQEFDKPENIDHAIGLFQEALKEDPKYAPAYAGLGAAYQQQAVNTREDRWLDQAAMACEKSASLDPSLTEAQVCLGKVRIARGEYEQAAAHFQIAVLKSPGSDEAFSGLGVAYGKLHRASEAESALRKAVQGRPDYWAGPYWLGRFYYDEACYEQAADMFQQVVKLAPDSFRGYSNLGAAYLQQGRYPDATRTLEKSLAIRSTASALSNLGVAHLALRRFPEAEAVFQQALDVGNRRYEVWANLAQARYFNPARKAQAAEAYRAAVEIGEKELKVNPRNAELLADLARYYARLGDQRTAQAYVQLALHLAPSEPEVLMTGAIAEIALGDREEALKLFGAALDHGQMFASVRDTPDFDELHGDPRFQELLRKAEQKSKGEKTCRLTSSTH